MRRLAIALISLALVFSPSLVEAKCILVPIRVQGEVVGEIQDGDVLLLRFAYSSKRVEQSSLQPVREHAFIVEGAFSTFKRNGVFHADVCGGKPRQIRLVMQDRNNASLDSVDLTVSDQPTGDPFPVNYGKRQVIVLHRQPSSH